MAADNPGGHGLALEVGLAAGMNLRRAEGRSHKTIVLIDPATHRYLGMARALSAFVGPTLEDGIAYIAGLIAVPDA